MRYISLYTILGVVIAVAVVGFAAVKLRSREKAMIERTKQLNLLKLTARSRAIDST